MLSGASCLIAEIVWSRYLHLIFGISAYAIAILLACFMLGFALGSWHIGRLVDRIRIAPGRLLAILEIAIGVCAAVSSFIYGRLVGADPVIYIVGSGLLLLIPTYLMGGVTPVFLKLLTPMPEAIGSKSAMFYALNTLGAAIGAFAAGFFFIRTVGLQNSLLIAAALNLAAAGIAMSISQPVTQPEPTKPAKKKSQSPQFKPVWPALVAVCFGVSGFVGMAYEAAYSRLLTLFFRDSIYDLTIVLTAFLVGSAIGGLLAMLAIRQSKSQSPAPLATVLTLAGFCGIASLLIVNRFPYWLNDLQTNTAMVQAYGQAYWTVGTLLRFAYAFLLLLIPSSLCGAMFPLVMAMRVDNAEQLGRKIGLLAGINAFGGALGAVAGGFLLANLLGLSFTIIVPAFMSIIAGVALLRNWMARIAIVLFAAVFATAPQWDKLRMSTSFLEPKQDLEKLLDLKFYREDAYGLTSVVELIPLSTKYLSTNRLYAQNNSQMMGEEDHRRLGHIPMLLHPNPQSVLAVGLGAGITLRGIHDLSPKQIDCVEIAPAVIEAARFFAEENARVLDQSNVNIIAKDGRHHLARTKAKYDVIVLDILHPMSAGSSTVFSREYYELCRSRLNDEGLVCQWMPIHQLTMPQIRTIIATFRRVFPFTTLWFGMIGDSGTVGCVGSSTPPNIDRSRLAVRYQDAALVRQLMEVNLNTPELLLGNFIVNEEATAAMSEGSPIDTDDHPVIEFAAPKIAIQSRQLGAQNLAEFRAMATKSP